MKTSARASGVAVLLALASAFLLCRSSAFAHRAPAALGSNAPDFGFVVGGIAQRLSAWRGEPVVLNFWATWCEPCRAELPLFAALANDEGPRLHVLSIAIGPPGSLHAYLAANALALPAIDDPAGALARTYGVSAIPVTVLIDGSGRIVDREIGELDRAGLVAALARVLPPPAPAAAPTALPAKAPADAI